ncbi:MAG TPA: deoxyribodipyrimidine photo-lyase [Pseudonocardiaceae bacterium]|nr:deoxyribodipyrimidine photo-lyase [Pseudonocardiaceae bacterium]
MSESALLWFRRDLRLGDHPALLAAAARSDAVLGVFVLDERLLAPSGPARRAFLADCLRALRDDLSGRLLVARGRPAEVLPRIADAVGAGAVCVSEDCAPYGRARDDEVATALAGRGVEFVRAGSPYAVTPGRVHKSDGTPYRVFTPFYRAWTEHGWRAPADTGPDTVRWLDPPATFATAIPEDPAPAGVDLPAAGERAALLRWAAFRDGSLARYHDDRERPDFPGTSRMSAYLRWGCVHPRTLLADLAGTTGPGPAGYRSELAWREFHADVLWHQPGTARHNYDRRFDRFRHDSGAAAEAAFDAWCTGRTGYPLVDAGMRQLLADGWMHNRVRMVVASFLVKDLHLPWWRGARHFMRHLVDGDLASNQLNWQWVAGCGTDAPPYFRVFNPVAQGVKFDPDGDYVRRYVPELRSVDGKRVHEPWRLPGGPPAGYPPRIVEHAHEREEALARYGAITG